MISWSIKAAIDSKCFQKVIVSTDDKEIAEIALQQGAEVPFLRPSHLATDQIGIQPVIRQAIEWLESNSFSINSVCCLLATAPFVKSSDLYKAFELLNTIDLTSFVFTATSFPFPIQRSIKIGSDGRSSMFYPENYNVLSQDLTESFHDAGQFYWASPTAWKQTANIFNNGYPLLLPRWRVQDIDTMEDLLRAEVLHEVISKKAE